MLERLLRQLPAGFCPAELLVGMEYADDAAVYRVRPDLAVIATVDFFLPVVDDPYDFGRIAATNALSDVYAMGGQPALALAVVGMPVGKLPEAAIAQILQGGADVCRQAQVALAGGHSIDCAEPFYGLVAIGFAPPDAIKTNAGAQPGDVLILTKPLGIGALSAALKQGKLDNAAYAEMLLWTTLLNRVGAALAHEMGVHAMTDVTGFGLAGHALEMARASGVTLRFEAAALPVLASAAAFLRAGVVTGASGRNWESYGAAVELPRQDTEFWRLVVTDPQTSGGLLIACAPEAVDTVLAAIRAVQEVGGTVIGRAEAGPACVVMQ